MKTAEQHLEGARRWTMVSVLCFGISAGLFLSLAIRLVIDRFTEDPCQAGVSKVVLYLLQHHHLDQVPDVDYLIKESCAR